MAMPAAKTSSESATAASSDANVAVGSVLVTHNDKSVAASAYAAASGDSSESRGFLLAILAPDADAATAYLSTQPAATYLLVIEEDSLWVYFKFRRAVRSILLLTSKEMKKQSHVMKWSDPDANGSDVWPSPLMDVVVPTPLHHLYVSRESFLQLEQCWTRFLPQVQVLLVELCAESSLNEDVSMDDWLSHATATRSRFVATLAPSLCGFFLLGTSSISPVANDHQTQHSTSTTLPLRQVEFDFAKCTVVVTDGVFKPNAFVGAMHLSSSKRVLDGGVTFAALRDNFLSPETVIIKDTITMQPPKAWQNCVDAPNDDAETTLLRDLAAACATIVPHEPLPDGVVDRLRRLFDHWQAHPSALSNLVATPWPKPKVSLAAQVVPYLMELLVAAAVTDRGSRPTDKPARAESPADRIHLKRSRFARALQSAILRLTVHSGEVLLCTLLHQSLQLFAVRHAIPIELVHLLGQLCAASDFFLALFLSFNGPMLLWNACCVTTHPSSARGPPIAALASASMAALLSSPPNSKGNNRKKSVLGGDARTRKSSLFGIRRQSHVRSRKSLDFSAVFAASAVHSKALVFYRLNPALAQMELSTTLRDDDFAAAAMSGGGWSAEWEDQVLHFDSSTDLSVCSTRMAVFELLQQLARSLLVAPIADNWDRDVALILSLRDIYESVFQEIGATVTAMSVSRTRHIQHRDLLKRLQMLLTLVAVLYRLEARRRKALKTQMGEKRYWCLLHLMRAQLREFNEHLELTEQDVETPPTSGPPPPTPLTQCLQIQLEFARHMPRPLLNEYMLVTLEDYTETAQKLHEELERDVIRSEHAAASFLVSVRTLFRVLRVFIKRANDLDLQTLILRVVGNGSPSLVGLLRFLGHVAVRKHQQHAPTHHESLLSLVIQAEVLGFLSDFLTLDMVSPIKSFMLHMSASHWWLTDQNDDDDALEQRKAVLMARVLSPDALSNDRSLWDYLVTVLLPIEAVTNRNGGTTSDDILPIVRMFWRRERALAEDDTGTTPLVRYITRCWTSFLHIRMKLYATQLPREWQAQMALDQVIDSHWYYFQAMISEFQANASQSSSELSRFYVDMACGHLNCLVVLAERRHVDPAVARSFHTNEVLPTIIRWLLRPGRRTGHLASKPTPSTTTNTTRHNDTDMRAAGKDDDGEHSSVPGSVMPALNLDLTRMTRTPQTTVEGVPELPNIVVDSPRVHSSALLFVLNYVLLEPAVALDDALCPRYFIPAATSTSQIDDPAHSSGLDLDVLWCLQNHLRLFAGDRAALLDLVHGLYAQQLLPAPRRLNALQTLNRLLMPDSFDRGLFVRACPVMSAATAEGEWQHVATGAFALVYKSLPAVSASAPVAIKTLPHQKHSGDLSVAHDAFEELSVLQHLRGNLAAVQLIDYGSSERSGDFELVLEYCPCTLRAWRASLPSLQTAEGEPLLTFRTTLLLVLRAFEEVCRALQRIHDEGVAHLDIKGDNVLSRTSAQELTRALLREVHMGNEYDASKTSLLDLLLCFGDFGESMRATGTILAPAAPSVDVREQRLASTSALQVPVPVPRVPTATFLVRRTRGTEAIKSPEMLAVRGSTPALKPITHASDVWSIGCLLFELITDELMFGKDDWAGLYAHLVAGTNDVVTKTHEEIIRAALQPEERAEHAIISRLIELLQRTLARSPSQRPSLSGILHLCKTITEDVQRLPYTLLDEECAKLVLGATLMVATSSDHVTATEPDATAATKDSAAPGLAKLLLRFPSRRLVAHRGVDHGCGRTHARASVLGSEALRLVHGTCQGASLALIEDDEDDADDLATSSMYGAQLCRLFWNFYVATIPLLDHAAVLERPDEYDFALNAIEAAYERSFDHFVYFCVADQRDHDVARTSHSSSSNNHVGTRDTSNSRRLFVEIITEDSRTTFFVNREWVEALSNATPRQDALVSGEGTIDWTAVVATDGGESDLRFVRSLLAQAPEFVPLFQRLLRQGGIRTLLLAPETTDMAASGALARLLSSVLLFFLTNCFSMTLLDAATLFASECAHAIDYPSADIMFQLWHHNQRRHELQMQLLERERDVSERQVVWCLCGACVFGVNKVALQHATAFQQCQCSVRAPEYSVTHTASARYAKELGMALGIDDRCVCFHPFQTPPVKSNVDASGTDSGDANGATRGATTTNAATNDDHPASAFVGPGVTGAEERLVHPMEATTLRKEGVYRWLYVDVSCVKRLESTFDCLHDTAAGGAAVAQAPSTATNPVAPEPKRQSTWRSLHHQQPTPSPSAHSANHSVISRSNGSARESSTPRDPFNAYGERAVARLLQDLKERPLRQLEQERNATSVANGIWKMFECEFCCFGVCAVSGNQEQIAFPFSGKAASSFT